jgi:hypothetical protein
MVTGQKQKNYPCPSTVHTYISMMSYLSTNYVHVIYPDELQIKDITESDIHVSASYLDILLQAVRSDCKQFFFRPEKA